MGVALRAALSAAPEPRLPARFRHTASIADATGGGGGHFANAPQRQGFQGADLNRHRIDASEDRAASLEPGGLT